MNIFFTLLICLSVAIRVFAGTPGTTAPYHSEKAMFKKAEQYYVKKDFENAMPLYAQLISTHADNYKLNYGYGICLLITAKDKSSAIKYLEDASKSILVWDDVWYYLGRAYQLNGELNKAVGAYDQFLKMVSPKQALRWEAIRQVEMCKNAMASLKLPDTLTLIDSRTLKEDHLYDDYTFVNDNRKLVLLTEEFLIPKDKKNPACLRTFLSANGNKMVYSSYGTDKNQHTDIYMAVRKNNGHWDKPKCMDKSINTKYDEAYPTLSEDGNTLYFSSKGFNSIGGFDIFKSVYDSLTRQWSTPVNMGTPINSFDDDFYFVPSEIENIAYYSSRRGNAMGEVTVFKIRLHNDKNARLVVNGEVFNEDVVTNRFAKVSVTNLKDGIVSAEFISNVSTGNYRFTLSEPGDYRVVVKIEGFNTLAQTISFSENAAGLIRQTITVSKDSAAHEKLTIISRFEDKISFASTENNEQEINQTVSTGYEPVTRYSNDGLPPVSEESKEKLLSHFKLVHETDSEAIPDALTNLVHNKLKGTLYRVQIGTFMYQTVEQVYEKLKEMGFRDISFYTTKRGWIVFYTGHEKDISEALKLKEIVLNYGFTDAFITVFQNGKRSRFHK